MTDAELFRRLKAFVSALAAGHFSGAYMVALDLLPYIERSGR